MNVDSSLLKNLAPEQLVTATQYLERIFLKKEVDILVEADEDIALFGILIRATTTEAMKKKLFFALAPPSQKKCFLELPYSDQYTLLQFTKNKQRLSTLFNSLENSLQEQCLSDSFQNHTDLYTVLKQISRPNISIQSGIILEKTALGPSHCQQHIQKLLEHIELENISQKDIKKYTQSLQSALNDTDLNYITEQFFQLFLEKRYTLKSKKDFFSYLKFFDASISLVVLFPEHIPLLETIMLHFLSMFHQLPGPDWVIKILNQLPFFILKKCLSLLNNYKNIKNPNTQKVFKLQLQTIKKHSDHPSAENIRNALNQL